MTEGSFYVMKDSILTYIDHVEFFYRDSSDVSKILGYSRVEEIKLFKCWIPYCNNKSEFIAIKENGLWGYEELARHSNYASVRSIKRPIKPKYISISSMANRYALVEYEVGKFGYIDNDGNEYFFR